MRIRSNAWVGVALVISLGLQAAVTYENDFSTAEIDQVPNEFLVLDGRFAVREFEGDKVLELPGSPLETYGVLFGSSARDGLAVTARIHGTRKGRRYPAFAVSLGGVSGFRLQITPAKRALELLQGDQVLQSMPWEWKSGAWTHLRLQIIKASDATWLVQGKAWIAGSSEPDDWVLTRSQPEQPVSGKPGIWGKPFSGTPIHFDDVRVARVGTTLAGILIGGTALFAQPDRSPVTAELAIPLAETHVIGDATPLLWRFKNNSDEALAFMWEGCCRLNGRLTVTSRSGQPIDLIPPGQALAHMFAKAERLDPGVVSEYDTRISDWVRLSESGTYALQGRYTGVLPTQQPQVPKGLALWRAAATTPPQQFTVISVADYLDQRAARAQRRGLELVLRGDSQVVPPQPVTLHWQLRNLTDREQSVLWPDDVQFWLVDAEGFRVVGVPTFFEGEYQELTLEPGQALDRTLTLDPIRTFEGVSFGDYRVFLDLTSASAERARVPSNAIPLTWRLDDATVADLVVRASSGSRLGFRNAPLKLLRVYLGEIGPQLERAAQIAGNGRARELATDLWRASRLKPLAPKPGAVTWPIELRADGEWDLGNTRLNTVAQELPSGSRLGALLSLRRHLGWSVGLSLQPQADVALSTIFSTASGLQATLGSSSGWIRAGTVGDLTNRLGGLTLRAEAVPAVALLRIQSGADGTSLLAHIALDAAPTDVAELLRAQSRPIGGTDELRDWLAALPAGGLVQIEAEPSLHWGKLTNRLELLLRRTDPVVLSPTD